MGSDAARNRSRVRLGVVAGTLLRFFAQGMTMQPFRSARNAACAATSRTRHGGCRRPLAWRGRPALDRRPRSAARTGGAFTLVEAIVAIALASIAGSALLLGVSSSLQTSADNLEKTIAMGIAEQLIDEVVGARYMEYGCSPYDVTLQPGDSERSTGTRERFDDIDDYNQVRSGPPVDMWGVALGQDGGLGDLRHPNFRAPAELLGPWREEIDVYYVDPNDFSRRLPWGAVSDFRAVEVRIVYVDPERGDRELARLRRIVAYVPPM